MCYYLQNRMLRRYEILTSALKSWLDVPVVMWLLSKSDYIISNSVKWLIRFDMELQFEQTGSFTTANYI